jgi:hypothetical protein
MQHEIDIGFEAELGKFVDGFGRRGRRFQRLDFVRRDLQIRQRFRAARPRSLALLNGRVGFTGCIGSVFSVRSNEQTAVGQGHLISSKYNIGFVRDGDAVIIRSPRGICGFVKAPEYVAGDGFLPIGRMERSRESNGFPVHSGARSACGAVMSKGRDVI